jgi:hypothetical protein
MGILKLCFKIGRSWAFTLDYLDPQRPEVSKRQVVKKPIGGSATKGNQVVPFRVHAGGR